MLTYLPTYDDLAYFQRIFLATYPSSSFYGAVKKKKEISSLAFSSCFCCTFVSDRTERDRLVCKSDFFDLFSFLFVFERVKLLGCMASLYAYGLCKAGRNWLSLSELQCTVFLLQAFICINNLYTEFTNMFLFILLLCELHIIKVITASGNTWYSVTASMHEFVQCDFMKCCSRWPGQAGRQGLGAAVSRA